MTVTDDRCPESNTYTHWTGRQSIVPWKHLRNIPRVPRARAHHVRATTACYTLVIRRRNGHGYTAKCHVPIVPTTQVAPFIAADILTPLDPSTRFRPRSESAPNVSILYETRSSTERERDNHRLIADHESRSVEWRSGAIHDARWYFGRPDAFRRGMDIIPAA